MEKKIVIYQTIPRLFGNKQPKGIPNGTIEQNGSGKFEDITPQALKAIAEMGVTHLWYTGIIEHAQKTDYSKFEISRDYEEIVKGNAGSPYAIKDYYDVDPDLAQQVPQRMQEFELLVHRTHTQGMKVIIDFVPNHVARNYHSDNNPGNVPDLGQGDDKSIAFHPQNNFYYIPEETFHCPSQKNNNGYSEYPAKATGNDHFTPSPSKNDWYETIKLNYGVDYLHGGETHFDPLPDTWLKMLDILLFWSGKNIDGFRCDMAHMVPVAFWHWVIPQIKQQYPNIIFIAEIYTPELYHQFINRGRFDYLYDKVGLYDTLKAVTQGHMSASAITHCWQSMEGIQSNMLYFLENHDEQRIASHYFAGDPWKAIPAMTITATFNTNPVMIYFGQEVGEPAQGATGFSGDDGRTTIFDYWGVPEHIKWMNNGTFDGALLNESQKRLRHFYCRLLELSAREPALVQGHFYDLMWANKDNRNINTYHIYAYLRYYRDQIFVIVVNFADNAQQFSLKIPMHAWKLMNSNTHHKFLLQDRLLSNRSLIFTPLESIRSGIPLLLEKHEACLFEINNMTIQHTKKIDLQTSLWSGGTTSQLAIFPPQSSYAKRDFLFRLSSARVDSETSKFTVLPNISRVIMILKGTLKLTHKDRYTTNLNPFETDQFQGDWITTSKGKVTDFNLMMAPGTEGEVEHIKISPPQGISFTLINEHVIMAFYAFQGQFTLSCKGQTLQVEPGDIVQTFGQQKEYSIKITPINDCDIILSRIKIPHQRL